MLVKNRDHENGESVSQAAVPNGISEETKPVA